MSDFRGARNLRCVYCGTPFCDVEGQNCDCDEQIRDSKEEKEDDDVE